MPELIIEDEDINVNMNNIENTIDDNNIIKENNIIEENDFADNLFNKYIDIKKKVKESKKKLIELKQNDKNSKEELDVVIKRNIFIDHIRGKLSKLYQRLRLIELKNNKYKRCYNCFNIGIILLSTSLTIVESTKVVIIDECDEEQLIMSKYFQLSPIIFGSIITCAASILKFKKYQEKMENISTVIEKGNISIGLLKRIKEDLSFCTTIEEYNRTEERYKTDIYDNYISVTQDIDRLLKNNDYDKYLEFIHNTDYKIHVLEQKRKQFFNNYAPEQNFNLNLKKKNREKSSCVY